MVIDRIWDAHVVAELGDARAVLFKTWQHRAQIEAFEAFEAADRQRRPWIGTLP